MEKWKKQAADRQATVEAALALLKCCRRLGARADNKSRLTVQYTLASGDVVIAKYWPAKRLYELQGSKAKRFADTTENFLDSFAPGALRPCDLYNAFNGEYSPEGRSCTDERILREQAEVAGRELQEYEMSQVTRQLRDQAWNARATPAPEEEPPTDERQGQQRVAVF